MRTRTLRPQITVSDTDHRQLVALAAVAAGPHVDAAESLLDEMERARVVAAANIPADIIRMGSEVQYRTEKGDETTVTLVFPANADISLGKISVLTPIGAALIGLRTGQSITWVARDGRKNVLTVTAVTQPVEQPEEQPEAQSTEQSEEA